MMSEFYFIYNRPMPLERSPATAHASHYITLTQKEWDALAGQTGKLTRTMTYSFPPEVGEIIVTKENERQ